MTGAGTSAPSDPGDLSTFETFLHPDAIQDRRFASEKSGGMSCRGRRSTGEVGSISKVLALGEETSCPVDR